MRPPLCRQLHRLVSSKFINHMGGISCKNSTGHASNQQFLYRVPVGATSLRYSSSTAATSLVSAENTVRSPMPDIDIPTNIPFHQFIFQYCDEYKDFPAVEDFLTGRKYSYKQLKENAIKVASALNKHGFRKGDVILTISPNTIDVTVLMLSCAAVGIWFSSANPTFTAGELSRQINHCGAKAVFCAEMLSEVVKDALIMPEFPHHVKELFVFGKADGFQPFQNLLDDDGKSFPDVDINPLEDVYTLPYSSGTTGLPKGVMLTHYNCIANCLQCFGSSPTTTSDNCLGLLPLYHIYGMIVVQFSVMIGGANLSYLPKFEPETFLKCLQDKKITLAHLVPPLVIFLAKHPMVEKFDLTSLKRIVCGAAPLGSEVTNELIQKYPHGLKLDQGYGMTELSPVTNFDMTQTAGSIGPLVCNTIGKIVHVETQKTLGPEESGEFCVKGPQIMKGYYQNKQATEEMIDGEGWLHTGDIGYFKKDGLFYIHDRMKELIKYKGSQVAPAELEALILGHPDVHDVAVLGAPDERAGELPTAFVVRKPGSNISEKEIVQFVEERVASTKWLRGGVYFIDEVPKNPSGKILRRVLKDKYL